MGENDLNKWEWNNGIMQNESEFKPNNTGLSSHHILLITEQPL